MTDYLDEVLAEVMAEDAPAEWTWGASLRPASVARWTEGAPEGQQTAGQSPVQEQVQPAAASAAQMSVEVSRIGRAARRALRPASALPAAQWGADAVPASVLAISAAQLDAVLQRDARRYDGPLGLL